MVTHFFSYYISNFASYNRLYGSIGTLIALMLWFFLLSFVILLGFEINACIDEAQREVRAKQQRRAKGLTPDPSPKKRGVKTPPSGVGGL